MVWRILRDATLEDSSSKDSAKPTENFIGAANALKLGGREEKNKLNGIDKRRLLMLDQMVCV